MKDFDRQPESVNRNEIGIVQKTKTEYKYVGTIRRKRGQTLFSFDSETKKIESVELQRNVAVDIDGKPLVSNKVTITLGSEGDRVAGKYDGTLTLKVDGQ